MVTVGDRSSEGGDDDPTALLRAPRHDADDEPTTLLALRRATAQPQPAEAPRTVLGPTPGARRVEATEAIDDPRLLGRVQDGPPAPSTVVDPRTPLRRAEATELLPSVAATPSAPQETTLALSSLSARAQEATLALSDAPLSALSSAPLQPPPRPTALARLRSSMQGTLIWINVVCGALIVIGILIILLAR